MFWNKGSLRAVFLEGGKILKVLKFWCCVRIQNSYWPTGWGMKKWKWYPQCWKYCRRRGLSSARSRNARYIRLANMSQIKYRSSEWWCDHDRKMRSPRTEWSWYLRSTENSGIDERQQNCLHIIRLFFLWVRGDSLRDFIHLAICLIGYNLSALLLI